MDVRLFIRWVGIVAISLASSSAWGQTVKPGETIGLYTAVQGEVQVTHPVQGEVQVTHPVQSGKTQTAMPVSLRGEVLFRDVIETKEESRTKALFEDDTLLTIGSNSRVEITQYIFDPDQGRRSTVIKLFKGRLRALVGKLFAKMGSKFEIHTPTAVAAARGTYFVMWIEPSPGVGVANIGPTGSVDFTSQGQTVSVQPGQYVVAPIGQAPIIPLPITSAAPKAVGKAIQDTNIPDKAVLETPLEVATKSGQAPQLAPVVPIVPCVPPIVPPQSPTSPIGPLPITPPAPISGASGTSTVTVNLNFGPGF